MNFAEMHKYALMSLTSYAPLKKYQPDEIQEYLTILQEKGGLAQAQAQQFASQ